MIRIIYFYLLLIIYKRCCFSCLYDPKITPTTLSIATLAFGLSKNEIEKKNPVVTKKKDIESCKRKKSRKTNKITIEKKRLTSLNKKAKNIEKYWNNSIWFIVFTSIPSLNTRDRYIEAKLLLGHT
jgi:hypothetical protein